jgi:hypothetical protein
MQKYNVSNNKVYKERNLAYQDKSRKKWGKREKYFLLPVQEMGVNDSKLFLSVV